jgi:DNA-binding CsgD family transcriptional regulator
MSDTAEAASLFRFATTVAHLTDAELESWILADRGMSQRNIALALGVSRSTIRSRLENAARKLANAQKEPAA